MGVSSTANRITAVGTGTTTDFVFPYYFFLTTDLQVYLYDTLLGGSVLQTQGSQYSIVGTPTYDGIYPTGATVRFVTAPPTTAIVTVVRNGPETQKFTLPQNGIIPSLPLVEQFDYLTLLVQRLQDQLNRAIGAPDGMGPAFSGVLPSNIALKPLSYIQINPTGTGMQLSDTAGWNKVSFTYAQVQTASMSNSLTLFTLPKGSMLRGLVIKSSTAFTGAGITALYAQVGVTAMAGEFINYYDLMASVADGNFDSVRADYIASFLNATAITVGFAATGANLSLLSAGGLDVYYQYQNIA